MDKSIPPACGGTGPQSGAEACLQVTFRKNEHQEAAMDSVILHLEAAVKMGEEIVDRNPNFCLTSEWRCLVLAVLLLGTQPSGAAARNQSARLFERGV